MPVKLIALAVLTVFVCRSQSFEVASIKLHDQRIRLGADLNVLPGGRIRISNLELRYIVEWAYSVKGYQISGAPDWFSTDRFDIEAKAEGNPSEAKMRAMLQKLLADRFHLKTHQSTKRVPVYILTIAKKVPTLKPTEKGTERPFVGYGPTGFAEGKPLNTYEVTGTNAPISLLAERLPLQSPVLDRTGLQGSFDFKFEYAADPNQPDSAPALTTAIRQSLGLRLQSAKGPIEILVIDHVEKAPTEN